jgi:heat shock protein HslJ
MFTLDKSLSSLMIGLLLLVVTACTPKSGSIPNAGEKPSPETQSSLANTKWTLVSFGEPQGETPLVDGSTVTLEFNTSGQALGSGGCNSYSAHYEVQGNTLSSSEITHTLMACQQEGIGQQEERYFRALETASKFELVGEHLTIWYDGNRGILNLVKSNGNFSATPTTNTTTEPTSIPTSAGAQSTPGALRINFEPDLPRPHRRARYRLPVRFNTCSLP